MPHVYQHTDVTKPTARTFECALECRRCEADTANGAQCRRTVCLWLPYCWQHTHALVGVRVAPSRALPGSLGLYAVRPFAEGDMVAPYGGEVLTDAQVRKRYGSGEHALGPYLLYSVDSACVRYVASAANGAFGLVRHDAGNVLFEPTCHRHGAVKQRGDRYGDLVLSRGNLGVKYWSVAQRDLREGEEILADYGTDHDYATAFAARQARCDAQGLPCDRTVRKRR